MDNLYKLVCKLDTIKYLPFRLSNDDIKKICYELMEYLSCKKPMLDTMVTINGKLSEFYSIRTKIHMSDVREIFKALITTSYFAIFICIFSFFKINHNNNLPFNNLLKPFKKSLITISIIILLVIIMSFLNFDYFFIKFHELVFNNDLWLLDPDVDYIICLLPENLFMIYAFRILSTYIILIIFLYLLLRYLSKIQLHQEAR